MEQPGPAKLLRIFIGESDKLKHVPLYELIVRNAREAGLAGATAWRGVLSYGRSSHLRTSKILDLSTDLPVIIEIVDRPEKIDGFIPRLNELFDAAQCGGLVTIEQVDVMRYTHGAKPSA
jgi:PII-like signaling protein